MHKEGIKQPHKGRYKPGINFAYFLGVPWMGLSADFVLISSSILLLLPPSSHHLRILSLPQGKSAIPGVTFVLASTPPSSELVLRFLCPGRPF